MQPQRQKDSSRCQKRTTMQTLVTLRVYIAYKLPAAQLLPFWIQNSAVFVQVTFFLYGKENKHSIQ